MAAMVVDAPLQELDHAIRLAGLTTDSAPVRLVEPAICRDEPTRSECDEPNRYVRGPVTRNSLFVSYAYAAQPAYAQDAPADPNAQPEAQPAAQSAATGGQNLNDMRDELDRREKELQQLERDLEAKRKRMQEMEARLSRMLEEAKQQQDKKLRHLIDVYSNMKAKQAATVLETLDEDIAVKILSGMRGRQAGEILSYVQAEKAASLSEKLTRIQTPFN